MFSNQHNELKVLKVTKLNTIEQIFYNHIKDTQEILHHSLYYTKDYYDWINQYATEEEKAVLQKISMEIRNSILRDFEVIIHGDNDFEYEFKIKLFSESKSLPTAEECDYILAELYHLSKRLSTCLNENELFFVGNIGRSLLTNEYIKKLIKINNLDESGLFKTNYNDMREYITMMLKRCYENLNNIQERNSVLNLAKEIKYFLIKKVEASYITKNHYNLNLFIVLLNNIDNNDYINLNSIITGIVSSTTLNKTIEKNLSNLIRIQKSFQSYLYMHSINNLKAADEINLLTSSENKPTSIDFLKIGNLILQRKGHNKNLYLACCYYEIAFYFEERKDKKDLFFNKIEKLYFELIKNGPINEPPIMYGVDIQLYNLYKEFVMSKDANKFFFKKIRCNILKFTIEQAQDEKYITRNENIHLSTILEQIKNNILVKNQSSKITLAASEFFKKNLENILYPILGLYRDDKLNKHDKQLIHIIYNVIQSNALEQSISHTNSPKNQSGYAHARMLYKDKI